VLMFLTSILAAELTTLFAAYCLDTVRQQLMFTVDIGVSGQVWYQIPSMKNPFQFPDFNTRHLCQNFEAVMQWAEERQLPETVPDDFLAPPNSNWDIVGHVPKKHQLCTARHSTDACTNSTWVHFEDSRPTQPNLLHPVVNRKERDIWSGTVSICCVNRPHTYTRCLRS
jgi:hypothetical protein